MIKIFAQHGVVMILPNFLVAFVLVLINQTSFSIDLQMFQKTLRLGYPDLLDAFIIALGLSIIALLINEVFNRYDFSVRKNSFAGLFFLLLSSFVPGGLALDWFPVVLALLLMIIVFSFRLYRKLLKTDIIFNLGFLIGCLILYDLRLWPLCIFGVIAVFQLSFFKIREFVLMIISFCLPSFLKYIYELLLHPGLSFWDVLNIQAFDWQFQNIIASWYFYIPMLLCILFYFANLGAISKALRIGPKKYLQVLNSLFLVILFIALSNSFFFSHFYAFVGLCLVFGLTVFVSNQKSFGRLRLLFYALLSMSLIIHPGLQLMEVYFAK